MYAYALYGTAVLAQKTLFLQLGNRQIRVVGFMLRPFYLRGKNTPDTHNRGWVNPRAGLNDLVKKKFLLLPGIEPGCPDCPARSLVTIATELAWLLHGCQVYKF